MANPEHVAILQKGVAFWNEWRLEDPPYLREADLSGADLHDMDLQSANLLGADLSGADLREANLSRAKFISRLTEADSNLSRAKQRQAKLVQTNLRGADLRGANLFKEDLSGVDLSGVEVSGVDLKGEDPQQKVVPPVAEGNIYILFNPGLKNLVKIGKTRRSPDERADELSSTGVPHRFVVVYEHGVSDCDKAEQEIHEALVKYRINKNREFFRLSVKEAISR